MKTGFRISLLLLAFVLVIGCAGMACADVIYTPMDDFFGTHYEECQYNDRYYITAGPNGTVTVYESPESDTVVVTLENGLDLYISWVYEDPDGILWGCWENFETGDSGWICLDDPTADYDTLFPEVEPPTEPTIEETQATEIPTEPVAEIVPKKTVNVPLLVGAVSLVVAATGGMLFALKRKK